MAYLGRSPAIGSQKVLDSIESQFNGSLTTFNLRYNNQPIYPALPASLIVSLGGVLQEPREAYTVISDTIVFASAPPAASDCWILLYSEYGAFVGGATAGDFTVSGDLTLASELHGPANLIIDPAAIGDDTGTVEIKGNLTVQGTTTTINSTTVDLDHLSLGDNEIANFGDGNDLQIYHDGSHSYVKDVGTGNLYIGADQNILLTNPAANEFYASFNNNGAVELFYDNSQKFETTSTGVTVTGNLIADNVGIGTNSPSANLHVASTGEAKLIVEGDSDNDPGEEGSSLELRTDAGAIRHQIQGGGTSKNLEIIAGSSGTTTAGNNCEIAFHTKVAASSSTERMRIDSSGNVGIGTSSPGYNLEVSSSGDTVIRARTTGTSSADDTIISLSNGGTTSSNYIFFGDNDDADVGNIRYNHSDDSLSITTNASEAMRISSSGNVGVGTDSPETKLDVLLSSTGNTVRVQTGRNDLPYTTYRSDIGSYVHVGYNRTLNALAFSQGANPEAADPMMVVEPTGNVGIGTSSPDVKLHVDEGGITANDTPEIKISSFRPAIRFYDKSNSQNSAEICGDNALIFRCSVPVDDNTALTEHMRITAAGNVGIGTNSPQQKFHVKGPIQVDGIGDAINGNYSRIYQNSSSSVDYGLQLKHYQGDTNDEDAAIIIGGNTTSREGNIVFYRDVSGTLTESARIDESGNFGIGTNSPDSLLHIASTGEARLIIDGDINNGANENAALIELKTDAGAVRHRIIAQEGIANDLEIVAGSSGTSSSVASSVLFSTKAASANSTERMRIEANGNVGIGTSNPLSKLHIQSSGNSAETVGMFGNANINNGLQVETIDGNLVWGFNAVNSRSLTLSTNQTERMRIDSSGNVGIGTSSPKGLLDVKKDNATGEGGTIAIRNTGSGIGTSVSLYLTPNNGGGDDLQRAAAIKSSQDTVGNYANLEFYTSPGNTPAERMRITSGGNVGIGTTSPAYKLEVGGDIKIGELGTLWFSDNSGSIEKITTDGSSLDFYADAEINFFESDANIRQITINTNTGNVGIGVVNPTCRIDMTGHVEIDGSAIGGILTSSTADDAYVDVTTPIKGGHLVITPFSTYDTFAQPVGGGMMYFDVGSSRLLSVVVDTDQIRTGGVARLISGGTSTSTDPANFTDGAVTITTPSVDTLRIFNRVGSARQFKLVFL